MFHFTIISKEEEKFSDKCEFCFDNAQKHLVVSVGKYVLLFLLNKNTFISELSQNLKYYITLYTIKKCYIRLPSNESLVEGTCMIIPMSHCKSSVVCDEEILNEIKVFVTKMNYNCNPKLIMVLILFSKRNLNKL